MNEMTIEEVEEILEDIGAYNHYANVFANISLLIEEIDSSLSEQQANQVIKVIIEELLQSF